MLPDSAGDGLAHVVRKRTGGCLFDAQHLSEESVPGWVPYLVMYSYYVIWCVERSKEDKENARRQAEGC